MPFHPTEYHRTVVSLHDHQNDKISCFIMRTLPFGAAASVHHFRRASYFLHLVELRAGLCWSAYFDDFPMVTHEMNEKGALALALRIMELTGFETSSMLGVGLNLEQGKSGCRTKLLAERNFLDTSTKCLKRRRY